MDGRDFPFIILILEDEILSLADWRSIILDLTIRSLPFLILIRATKIIELQQYLKT